MQKVKNKSRESDFALECERGDRKAIKRQTVSSTTTGLHRRLNMTEGGPVIHISCIPDRGKTKKLDRGSGSGVGRTVGVS